MTEPKAKDERSRAGAGYAAALLADVDRDDLCPWCEGQMVLRELWDDTDEFVMVCTRCGYEGSLS